MQRIPFLDSFDIGILVANAKASTRKKRERERGRCDPLQFNVVGFCGNLRPKDIYQEVKEAFV